MLFFFNDTATTEIYTLSLHDALPIFSKGHVHRFWGDISFGGSPFNPLQEVAAFFISLLVPLVHSDLGRRWGEGSDRKSTRLNSSHANISYAVFCLKKKTPVITIPHIS